METFMANFGVYLNDILTYTILGVISIIVLVMKSKLQGTTLNLETVVKEKVSEFTNSNQTVKKYVDDEMEVLLQRVREQKEQIEKNKVEQAEYIVKLEKKMIALEKQLESINNGVLSLLETED